MADGKRNHRDPKYLDQIRRSTKARLRATKILIAKYRAEFDAIYEKEAAKVGVIPVSVRRRKRAVKLRKLLTELEGGQDHGL
jgi:hypothetical protein